MGSGSSPSTDSSAHKRGPKPKTWKEKHQQAGRDSSKKRETEEKKEKKPPSFLMQTASGRMPKVANRFEASTDPTRNKGSINKTEEGNHSHGRRKSNETFEKSAIKLEKDLELLPASGQKVTRCDMVVKKENVKKEEEEEEEMMEEDGEVEEEEEEEESEDRYELTEWFPPDSWPYLKVFVTDVTVDNVTVTMRECKTPEGFFSQPTS